MNDSQDVPDGELIAATLAGQSERFGEIVRRYQTALLRLAVSRLGRLEWAEEAVQESFLCAFKSLASYDSRYSFRTWLWTILLNQCRRQWQRRQRYGRSEQRAQFVAPGAADGPEPFAPLEPLEQGPGPESRLLAKERTELLESLLDQLPETHADALRLRFFGGLKFQEIADAMQCSLSSAKARVRVGLTRLGLLMSERQDEGQTVPFASGESS